MDISLRGRRVDSFISWLLAGCPAVGTGSQEKIRHGPRDVPWKLCFIRDPLVNAICPGEDAAIAS